MTSLPQVFFSSSQPTLPYTPLSVSTAEAINYYNKISESRQILQELLADDEYPPDYYRTCREIVERAGFGFEQHQVVTEDGYYLNVFRVMNADVQAGKQAPVVFMQHGLMDTADTWVMNEPEKAPAFTMARAGYDVWLGNNRGN